MPRRNAAALFVDNNRRQAELLCGKASFRTACRLTGFALARRIIRIRTNATARPPRQLLLGGVLMAMEVTATSGDKIRCDACPVMCYIKPGAAGACDRYSNHDGQRVGVDAGL